MLEYFAANKQDINLRPYTTAERIFDVEPTKNEEVDFATVRGMDVHSAHADEIEPNIKNAMVKLAKENYPLEPEVPKEIEQKIKKEW